MAAGFLTYGTIGLAGKLLLLQREPLGLPFVGFSGALLALWYSRRSSPLAPGGRQINKRLARAPRWGPAAYGAVLGTGILTIVATPAVWLGLVCCLAIADPLWAGVYGLSFGLGRAAMNTYDTHRARAMDPAGVTFLVLNRNIAMLSRFRWWGVAGGLTLLGLVITSFAVPAG